MLWWTFGSPSLPAIVLSLRGTQTLQRKDVETPWVHPRENSSPSWQPYTGCVALFKYSSLTRKLSHQKRDSFTVWVCMENAVASLHLSVVSHSVCRVSRGHSWRVRFLHNTKQMNPNSNLVLLQWRTQRLLSRAKQKKLPPEVCSESQLMITPAMLSPRNSLCSLLRSCLPHTSCSSTLTHPQPWAAAVYSAFIHMPIFSQPLLFVLHTGSCLAWKRNSLASGSKVSRCHLSIQHPTLTPKEANEAAAPTL